MKNKIISRDGYMSVYSQDGYKIAYAELLEQPTAWKVYGLEHWTCGKPGLIGFADSASDARDMLEREFGYLIEVDND